MKLVSPEELINHKILPFNIYSEFGEKLFAAGELLTPGKLLQLKHMNILYRDEEEVKAQEIIPDDEEKQKEHKNELGRDNPESNKLSENKQEQVLKLETTNVNNSDAIVEVFDMKPTRIQRNKFSVDDIDVFNYKGPINKSAKIDPQTQLKIKAFYNKILSMLEDKSPIEMLGMFANVRDKIVQDILSESNEVIFSSQLKLLGEYNKCHALNTAILSGALAIKMGLTETAIYDIVLAGLLHDVGKGKLPTDYLSRSRSVGQEQNVYQEHTKIGYKIIKVDMSLPEIIARPALEHHEHNDGSGYPNGKSGEQISIESRIINVCNYFDNLTSNRTGYEVKNTKDAIRIMLEHGTQRFSAEALYTFIHMFSYNDTTNFEEMIL